MLVGDDYFVTNIEYLQKGITEKYNNAILLKANQIGTITEMLETIKLAKNAGFKTIISHRYKVNDFCDSPVKIGREIFLLFYKEEDFRFKTTITGLASSVRLRRAGIAASCSGWIK